VTNVVGQGGFDLTRPPPRGTHPGQPRAIVDALEAKVCRPVGQDPLEVRPADDQRRDAAADDGWDGGEPPD
jgi:hypothetical protein